MLPHLQKYVATSIDYVFVLRPRRFVAAIRDAPPGTYMAPYAFLVINLTLGAAATLVAAVASGDLEAQAVGLGDQLIGFAFAGLAVFYRATWVLTGLAVAFILALPIRVRPLIDALCYATVFLPLNLFANSWIHFQDSRPLHVLMLVLLTDMLAIIYFVLTAGACLCLKPGFMWRFATLSGIAIVLPVGAVGVFLGVRNRETTPEQVPGCSSAELRATAITHGAQIVRAWFEWGPGHTLTHRTPVQVFYQDSEFTQTISGLPEGSLFSYQSVAENAYGTVRGDTVSLITSVCREAETG